MAMVALFGTTFGQIRVDGYFWTTIPPQFNISQSSSYVLFGDDGGRTFTIVDDQHQPSHTISIPEYNSVGFGFVDLDYVRNAAAGSFTQTLFNDDYHYEYVSRINDYSIEVRNENGTILHTFTPDEGFRFLSDMPTFYWYRGQYVLISCHEESVNNGHWKTVWFKMDMQDRNIRRIGSIDYVAYNQYCNGLISAQHTASDSPQLIHHDNDTITIYDSDLHSAHTFTTIDTVLSIIMHDLDAIGSTTGAFSSRITQTLFNNDNKYEYITRVGKKIEIRNEDGTTLYTFDCTRFENWMPSYLALWKISGHYYAEIKVQRTDYLHIGSVLFELDFNTQNVRLISDGISGTPTIIPAQFNTSGNHQFYLDRRIHDSNLNPISHEFNVDYNNNYVTFEDLDNLDGLYNGHPVLLTQTLFNNDELYEFVIVNPSPNPSVVVKNENGDTLYTFHPDEGFDYIGATIIKYGGKYYFVIHESNPSEEMYRKIWYQMDIPTQRLIRVDATSPIIVHPTVATRGQAITIELNGNSDVHGIFVFNTLGHMVKHCPAIAGQHEVLLSTGDLQSGIYFISTIGGTLLNSCKIIVR